MKKFLNNNSGITLVALVVTIIVLIILAIVTVSAVVGNDGIILGSMEASVETEKQDFLENAKTAYSELYTKNQAENNFKTVTLKDMSDLLINKYGFRNRLKVVDGDSRIEIQETNVSIGQGEEKEIIATLEEDVSLFLEINKKYYPVIYDGEDFSFGKPVATATSSTQKHSVGVRSDNSSVATVTVYETNKIKITGIGEGKTKITATYGNSKDTVEVNVGTLTKFANTTTYVNVNNSGKSFNLKSGWEHLYTDPDNVENPKIYLIYETDLEKEAIPTSRGIEISDDGKVNYSAPDYKYTDLDEKIDEDEELTTDEEVLREEKEKIDHDRREEFEKYLSNTETWEAFSVGIAEALTNKGVNITFSQIKTVGTMSVEQFEKVKTSVKGSFWLYGGTDNIEDNSKVKCTEDSKSIEKRYYEKLGLRPVVAIPKNEQTLKALGLK